VPGARGRQAGRGGSFSHDGDGDAVDMRREQRREAEAERWRQHEEEMAKAMSLEMLLWQTKKASIAEAVGKRLGRDLLTAQRRLPPPLTETVDLWSTRVRIIRQWTYGAHGYELLDSGPMEHTGTNY
jgi:hypothetical protein